MKIGQTNNQNIKINKLNKENIDIIVVKTMEKIMQDIEEQKLIYHNEEQFQFDLAWRINKCIDENSGIRILLENFSMIDNSENIDENSDYKKLFTDILIIDNEFNFIPIELKYKKYGMKTKINKKYFVELGNDGAADLGKFDYLWDIHRIEQLTNVKKINEFENKITLQPPLNKGTFICGYAIMITDDNSYWTIKNGSCADKMTLNNEIKEIRWQKTTRTDGTGIMSGNRAKKYFTPLISLNKKPGFEDKFMPLKGYNFSDNVRQNSNTKIITINEYECFRFKGRNKENKTNKYEEEESKIQIKAFIAKIEKD